MADIVVILLVRPLLHSLGHYTASRILARDRGTLWLGIWRRQLSWNSVYAGSQRWSLLGDSKLGALGPLAQCVVMASQARAKWTPASPCPAQTPKANVERVDFGSFSPNSF